MSTDYTDTQLEMLTRRWKQDASPHLSLQLADVYRQRGEIDKALPVLERGLEAHPGHVSVQVALGRYWLEAGNAEAAAAVLLKVVDKDAGHLVANKLLVRAHLALGDRKSAADRLELYALLNDNDPELETLRATVEGGLPVTVASLAAPTLPSGFAAARVEAAADLASVPPPGRRGLTGEFDREPFPALRRDPLVPALLPDFFHLEAAQESPLPPAVSVSKPVAEPEPALGLEAEPVPQPEPEVALGLEAEPVPQPEPEPALGLEAEPVPQPEPEAGLELEAEPVPQPEPEVALPEPEFEVELEDAPAAAADTPEELAESPLGGPTPLVEEAQGRPGPEPVDVGSAATATLGALYLAQGHLEDARNTFERVLRRDPDDAEARAGLAEVETRLGSGGEPREAPEGSGRRATIAHLESYLARIRRAADRLSA